MPHHRHPTPSTTLHAALLLALAGCTALPQAGTTQNVSFTQTTPLTSTAELLRRSLDPAAQRALQQTLRQAGQTLPDQPLQPAGEHFQLFIPSRQPAAGYALLVFSSPAETALVPGVWRQALSRFGVICVTAAAAGNDANVLSRREPLALLAEQNAIRRFHIDPSRIWVAGFSGGARVAMRLALAYPDLFTGAILDAGSDPIGPGGIPLPPPDLAARFAANTRLVYVNGEYDDFHLNQQATSEHSMAVHCVQHLARIVMPNTGHALMDGPTLGQALRLLTAPLPAASVPRRCAP